jgi:hypothetical protein
MEKLNVTSRCRWCALSHRQNPASELLAIVWQLYTLDYKGPDGYLSLRVVGLPSVAVAPCVVILHADDKGGAILVLQRLGESEDQRISGINGNIDLSA